VGGVAEERVEPLGEMAQAQLLEMLDDACVCESVTGTSADDRRVVGEAAAELLEVLARDLGAAPQSRVVRGVDEATVRLEAPRVACGPLAAG